MSAEDKSRNASFAVSVWQDFNYPPLVAVVDGTRKCLASWRESGLMGSEESMNVPNRLTISRFVLTFAFLVVIFAKLRFYETVALVLFGVAGLTDYFDGKIARRDHLITNFGILMDPLADKIMVCSAFIAFVGCRWAPAWMVVIIVAREFAITGLRLLAASKSLVLAADRLGKHKTIAQIVAIISVLVLHGCGQWGVVGDFFSFNLIWGPWVSWFAWLSLWVAVILTLISGVVYLWRNRGLYLADL
jgi:CDP-diacylglycerol---glycerol-3-phosphate 3-phosphatidyltransferase